MCLVHFVVVCLIYALPHRFSRSCSHAKSVATGVSQRFLVLPHVPFSMPILFNLRCKYFLGRFWQYGNKIKIELIELNGMGVPHRSSQDKKYIESQNRPI